MIVWEHRQQKSANLGVCLRPATAYEDESDLSRPDFINECYMYI